MERLSLSVSDGERAGLGRLIRARGTPQKVVLRAKIVLASADGLATSAIMHQLQTTCPAITRWRQRYAERGVEGLCKDATRPGRRRRIGGEQVGDVIERTLHSTPVNATHWSVRTMAKATALSPATIQRIWSNHGLQPHRVKNFKLSSDPRFLEKLKDVAGLYLDPPEKAIVFCVDEKSQIQALGRSQPGLPMKKGRAGTMTHGYKRHGTTTLFAALNVATGEAAGECYERHRHDESLAFLKKLYRQTPKDLTLHVIVDN